MSERGDPIPPSAHGPTSGNEVRQAGHKTVPASGLLASVILWFFCHPYTGIEHDTRVYLLMALRWLNSQPFAQDPWFVFGSQDQWTIFSPVYAAAISLLGVEAGSIVLAAVGGIVLAVAAWSFATGVLRGRAGCLLALLLVSVPLSYAPINTFYVMETFTTSRTFAVGLSLLALAAGLRQHWVAVLVLHGLALLFHPIMALAPAATSFLLRFSGRGQVVVTASGWAGFALMCAGGRFGLLGTISSDWEAYLDQSPLIFVSGWVVDSGSLLFGLGMALFVAARYGTPRARGLYRISALVVASSLWAAVLLEVFSPVTLFVQAQFWRALWFGEVVGVCALVDLICRHVVRRNAPCRQVYFVVGSFILATGSFSGWVFGLCALCLLLFPKDWQEPFTRFVVERSRIFIGLALVLWIPVALNFLIALQTSALRFTPGGGVVLDTLSQIRVTGAFGIVAVCVALCWSHKRLSAALLPLLAVLLAMTVSDWDWREAGQRGREKHYAVSPVEYPFSTYISPGDVVFWAGETDRVWFEMGTAAYASASHTIGLVFSYGRTLEMQRRLERVAVRTLTDHEYREFASGGGLIAMILEKAGFSSGGIDGVFKLHQLDVRGESTEFGIRHLCEDRALDFVIEDANPLGEMARATRTENITGHQAKQSLYDCKKIRGS